MTGDKIKELKRDIIFQRLFALDPELVGVSFKSEFKSTSSTLYPYKVPEGVPDIRELDPSTPAPANKKAAKNSIYWPHYHAAEELEIATLKALGAWVLVPRNEVTKGAKVLRGRWVYAHKKKDGKISYAKARYVAQGCFQTEGVDYESTFASVMTLKTWRMMLSLANSDPKIELGHADVKAAYVMAEREIPAFCEQPEGHEDGDAIPIYKTKAKRYRLVCKLLKSLYGLKDSGYLWQKTLAAHLAKIGFKPLPADPATYILRRGDKWCLVATYVDDLFVCNNDPTLRNEVLKHMASAWEIKYDEELQWALNTRIYRNRETGVLKVSQEAYIRELLTKFGMEHAKPATTPARENEGLPHPTEVTPEEMAEVKGYRFRELIGALLWIATVSRPDIAVAVNYAARYQHRPTKKLWSFLTRILRYLKKYPDYGLVYKRHTLEEGISPLEIFVDASFAPDVDFYRGKSIIGYVVKYLGNVVHWVTTKSKRTLQSSTEAECNGLAEAAKENTWQRDLITQIGIHPISVPTPIYEDNSGTRALCDSKTYHKRSKHFGLEWYATKEKIADHEIVVKEISTDKQLADFLTKPLAQAKHDFFRDELMGNHLSQKYFEDKVIERDETMYVFCEYDKDRQLRLRA